jgi:DNA-binding phage protein
MQVGSVYVGYTPQGDLAKIMTERQWTEADSEELRPNTNWIAMTLDQAMRDEELRHYVIDLRVKDIVVC